MGPEGRRAILDRCLAGLGPHDAPVRELEMVDYTFEFLLDYGAYREFKRHRMQSYLPQPLTVAHGYRVPPLLVEAGLKAGFEEAMGLVERAYPQVYQHSPLLAQYLVTHAHNRRVLSKLNLRECYHLFKLRTSELAHFSIRAPVQRAMKLAVETHPGLFRHLLLRDYPDWWPFTKPGEG
jgi:thymidylate synthase ThyX